MCYPQSHCHMLAYALVIWHGMWDTRGCMVAFAQVIATCTALFYWSHTTCVILVHIAYIRIARVLHVVVS